MLVWECGNELCIVLKPLQCQRKFPDGERGDPENVNGDVRLLRQRVLDLGGLKPLAGRGCRDQPPLPRGLCCDLTEKMPHGRALFSLRYVSIIPPYPLANNRSQVWEQTCALWWGRAPGEVSLCVRGLTGTGTCVSKDCQVVTVPGAGLSRLLRWLLDGRQDGLQLIGKRCWITFGII